MLDYCNLDIGYVSCVGLSADAMEIKHLIPIFQQEFYMHYECKIPFYPVDHHMCEITLLEQRLQDPPRRRLADIQNHVYPLIPHEMRNQQISLARKYEQFTYLLGFGFGQAGKTMGLASSRFIFLVNFW